MTLISIVAVFLAYFIFKSVRSNIKSNQEQIILQSQMEQLDPLNSTQPLRVFRTKVVGVSYHNKDGTHRQDVITKCRIGEKLLLVPEPTNLHDADAVKVMRLKGEQIGTSAVA